jgi:ferredoxin
MEVEGGYVVPGEAGCGACLETWSVVYDVGDDHLQNLSGKSVRLSTQRSTCAT